MKSKFSTIVTVAVCIAVGALVVYAATQLFASKTVSSDISKKTIFEFDLNAEMQPTEVGPGDSFTVKPKVYNDATEDMYVFIQVDQPGYADGGLYTYEVNSAWKLIENQGTTQIYAYGGDEMLTLTPGETTDLLTEEMTMKEISNAEYSQIDDLNVSITGYAIGTEDISVMPSEAWEQCKTIGNLE